MISQTQNLMQCTGFSNSNFFGLNSLKEIDHSPQQAWDSYSQSNHVTVHSKSFAYALGEQFVQPVKEKIENFIAVLFGITTTTIDFLDNQTKFPTANAQQVDCEWGKARKIIMHQPGNEVSMGLLHPKAALFEKIFNPSEAINEHQNYIDLLRRSGAEVLTITDILLAGTEDPLTKENTSIIDKIYQYLLCSFHPCDISRTCPPQLPKKNKDALACRLADGSDLQKLRQFALNFLTYEYDDSFSLSEKQQQERYRVDEVIMKMSPKELVNVILNRPTVHLRKTEKNTYLEASYSTSPVMNMYFLRDQMITTKKGIVISKMNSSQRFPEVEIVKFALEKLRITPLYEISGNGRLEGGDFIPAGNFAFIGQGLRTNEAAIKQLIDNDVFGSINRLIVVKDAYKNQDQMHLDTYFNVINSNKAVLIDTRFHTENKQPSIKTHVDVYLRDPQGIFTKEIQDADFVDYITKKLNFKIIPVSNDDQLRYGINFLTVKPDTILAIDGVSTDYKQKLSNANVHATWMDFSALTSGYGAAHCTTQVIEREGCGEQPQNEL